MLSRVVLRRIAFRTKQNESTKRLVNRIIRLMPKACTFTYFKLTAPRRWLGSRSQIAGAVVSDRKHK